ncbi:type II toxin-antitoxin system prevent-host-death family antitoxin [Pseudomonas sp. 3MA1]|uniref:type II toxin-antitoxin system Phd/YefM family antitoxin n=1 Tax=Pseudomonas sp. 3MA1 TaxID=2699196 RepID=UPI0023DDDE6B|nr:type II toxin-antitoxin system prevent-host-death family antitoxin [Pseudomonas sp. 3MA1]MDF2394670.1 type II toxin-antitoxin system prevent-host-death family antitoxin [Pseudomonas sp. 3MA1]
MHYIDYAELEANFEHYVERAYNGEEIVITRDGEPLVKLVPCQPKLPRIGFLKGQFAFDAEVFSAMDKEVEDLFYASEIFPEDSSVAGPEPTKPDSSDKNEQ